MTRATGPSVGDADGLAGKTVGRRHLREAGRRHARTRDAGQRGMAHIASRLATNAALVRLLTPSLLRTLDT